DEADVLIARSGAAPDAEERAVVAAQAHGRLAVTVQAQHDVLVDLADEHHLGDLDGVLVGHAQAAHELDGQAETLHVRTDLRATPMDDDWIQPDVLQQHHVERERLAQRRILHRGAAVLDDHRPAVKPLDVRERLEQRAYVAHRIDPGLDLGETISLVARTPAGVAGLNAASTSPEGPAALMSCTRR